MRLAECAWLNARLAFRMIQRERSPNRDETIGSWESEFPPTVQM